MTAWRPSHVLVPDGIQYGLVLDTGFALQIFKKGEKTHSGQLKQDLVMGFDQPLVIGKGNQLVAKLLIMKSAPWPGLLRGDFALVISWGFQLVRCDPSLHASMNAVV